MQSASRFSFCLIRLPPEINPPYVPEKKSCDHRVAVPTFTRNVKVGHPPSSSASRRAISRGWPTFTLFVKVGTTRSDAAAFLSKHRTYAFGEAGTARVNQWAEAKIKVPTPAA